MPVYEYHCGKCGCRFEQYREVSQRASYPCPKCGKPARKGFQAVGIVFKGSGFHVTDYPSPVRGGPAEDKAKSESEAPKPEPTGVGGEKKG